MQHQRRLDQPQHPCSGIAMADIRFAGPQRDTALIDACKGLLEPFKFNRIA